MQRIRTVLKEHKFSLHLLALFLMLIPPVPMYFAARGGSLELIWFLVAFVVIGNLLVIIIP
jgi:hypothetical protein